MPEIKNTFLKGRMNKDLDERLVPKGEYRDAMNIEISTSEGSDVGTVQTILGNTIVDGLVTEDFNCVGSISNEKTNSLYWFIKSSIKGVDAILEYDLKTETSSYVFVDTKSNTDSPVLRFPNRIITGINIIDNLLFWTDGEGEPKKINIDRCKQGTVDINTHTQLVINSENLGDIEEENITVIKKKPTKAPIAKAILDSLKYENNNPNLFEKTFSRFSCRYKYVDGEYSAFGPFSNVVFNPFYVKNLHELDDTTGTYYNYNSQNSYTTKEPFNASMINRITSIEIYDFISPDMPKDVVEVEILYKQENSPVIYSIAKLQKKDTRNDYFNLNGYNQNSTFLNSEYKGYYSIKTENIYAALPENQFIRVFDAVPKKALAQEVTGNRIVYGNYTQGYNLDKDKNNFNLLPPEITLDYEDRINDLTFNESPLRSLKSLRNYQIGVVFGDKYGRETPVFTSSESAVRVNWKQNSILNASRSLSLKALYNSNFPTWADYFKFYIKETSTEHYNLIMDKVYSPTSAEDLNNDTNSDHVWISFFSSDRNKIDIENYIILKKIVNKQTQIYQDNKFKVIDIKNEAPDSIKFDYNRILEASNDSNQVLGNLFNGDNLTKQTDLFKLIKTVHQGTFNGGKLDEFISSVLKSSTAYYIYWKADGESSKKYRIIDVRVTNSTFVVKLNEKVTTNDNVLASHPTISGTMREDLVLFIDKKESRDLDQFSGRFFVKIVFDYLVNDIQGISQLLLSDFKNLSSTEIRWWSDEVTVSNGDQTTTLVNHTGNSSSPHTGTISTVTFGSGVTSTVNEWDNLASDHTGFFIDQMYFCAGQVNPQNSLAKYAIDIMRGMSGADTSGGTSYLYASWTDNLTTPITHPAISNPVNRRNFIGGTYGMTNPITKNFYPFIFNRNHISQSGTNTQLNNPAFLQAMGPVGAPLGSNKGTWRWSPFDKDVDSSGGYNIHGRFNFNSDGLENDPSFIGNINFSGNLNIGGNYAEHLLPKTHPYTDTPIATFASMSLPMQFGDSGYNIDPNSIVNGLDGIVTSTSNHTLGNRVWRSEDLNSLTNATTHNIGTGSVRATFVRDNTYGSAGDEGKHYMHLSFLAPGKNLVPDNLDLSSAEITGNSCIGAYLQGIHGGGIFTKSAKDIQDDGAEFNNSADFYSPRIIECERSSDNTVNLDIGYNQNYQPLHDKQWDPVENASLTNAQVLEIQNFIDNIKIPNAKFKFSGDINSNVYTIKSVKVKYLYNHTPWKRRYIVNPSYNNSSTFQDQYGTTGNLIPAGDSVEEAAVAWAIAKENNNTSTITAATNALEQKIKDFASPSNRRVVYILELNADPTNSNYDPTDGSNITSTSAATANEIQFLTNIAYNDTSIISSVPAIWETEPKGNQGLEIYYEASDAIPLRINEKNRELYAPIGCKVEVLNIQDSNPGQDVFLESWGTNANGSQFITVSPGFNEFDSNGNKITYGKLPPPLLPGQAPGGVNAVTSKFKFIREDGSYTILIITDEGDSVSGLISNFTIKRNIANTGEYGLSWYNCFSFGNGIESNRIRDDFNQMQILNGARASAVLEEPYGEENRKNGLIYSGIYNSTSGINNLNQFVIGEKITKDLNPTYGSIQKLFQRRISLVAFCEDKVVSIVSNKDALFNADGNPQLISSSNVLGDATPFVGDYGISKNPESFASESYRAYFTDKQRGVVLRLSMDGLTPISDAGMSDWFRDNLIPAKNILGSYDAYNQNYNLTLINDSSYYNILKNSFFDQGTAPGFISQNTSHIANQNFTNSTPTLYPQALQHPWLDSNNEAVVKNESLNTNVFVTFHDEIPEGHFVDTSGASSGTTQLKAMVSPVYDASASKVMIDFSDGPTIDYPFSEVPYSIPNGSTYDTHGVHIASSSGSGNQYKGTQRGVSNATLTNLTVYEKGYFERKISGDTILGIVPTVNSSSSQHEKKQATKAYLYPVDASAHNSATGVFSQAAFGNNSDISGNIYHDRTLNEIVFDQEKGDAGNLSNNFSPNTTGTLLGLVNHHFPAFDWDTSSIRFKPNRFYFDSISGGIYRAVRTSSTSYDVDATQIQNIHSTAFYNNLNSIAAHDLNIYYGEVIEIEIEYRYYERTNLGRTYGNIAIGSSNNNAAPLNRVPNKDNEIKVTLFDGNNSSPIASNMFDNSNIPSSVNNLVNAITSNRYDGDGAFNQTIESSGTYQPDYVGRDGDATNGGGICKLKLYFKTKDFTDNYPVSNGNFNDNLAIDNLQVEVSFAMTNADHKARKKVFLSKLIVSKKQMMTSVGESRKNVIVGGTGTTNVTKIPSTKVPAWAEVRYEKPDISIQKIGSTQWDEFVEARRIFGTPTSELNLTTTNHSASYTDPTTQVTTTYTWVSGNQSNGKTYHKDELGGTNLINPSELYDSNGDEQFATKTINSDRSISIKNPNAVITLSDKLEVTSGGAMRVFLDMKEEFVLNEYYAVDIVPDNTNNFTLPTTYTSPSNVYMQPVVSVTGSSANQSPFVEITSGFNTQDVFNNGTHKYPNGHYGFYVPRPLAGAKPLIIAKEYDRSNDPKPYHDSATMPDNVYRVIFKCTQSGAKELHLLINNANSLVIDAVNVVPLSRSAPDANGQVTTINSPSYRGSINDWGERGADVYRYHLLSPLYYYIKNNSINFNSSVLTDIQANNNITTAPVTIYQTFSSLQNNFIGTTSDEFPNHTAFTDDYDFIFEIGSEALTGNFTQNSMTIDLISVNGFKLSVENINAVGKYKLNFNEFNFGAVITITIYDNANNIYVPVSSIGAAGITASMSDLTALIGISPGFYGAVNINVPTSSPDNVFSVNNISLQRNETVLSSGSIDNWVIANDLSTPTIVWLNGTMVFNDTPKFNSLASPTTSITQSLIHVYQNIPNDLVSQAEYKINFTYSTSDPNTAGLKMYYYNSDGQGFSFDFNETGAGSFEITKTIGDETYNASSDNFLQNAFVIYNPNLTEATYRLDNLTITRTTSVSLNKTLSFNEDVKGWTSFKSFAPETGLSLAKAYYTTKEGKLYKHNTGIVNNFYNKQHYSSITTLLNEQPSVIKSFRTLSYEGTQAKVTSYGVVAPVGNPNDIIGSTVNTYNLSNKQGWYVNKINSNDQDGFVDEFIEKESKWFNYIQGTKKSNDLSTNYVSQHTGDFSFQGIGEVNTVVDMDPNYEPKNVNFNITLPASPTTPTATTATTPTTATPTTSTTTTTTTSTPSPAPSSGSSSGSGGY